MGFASTVLRTFAGYSAHRGNYEVIGQVAIGFTLGRWSVSTTLSAPWYGVAFLHYLERTLHNCGRENATAFVAGMARNLGQVLAASADGSSLTETQLRSLFDGFRERTPPSLVIKASAEFARRPDQNSPLGYNYFALTDFGPGRLMDQDVLHSLVPFYDRLFALPIEVSILAVKALAIQLHFYLSNGPPKLRTLGRAPNVAMYEALKDTYGGSERQALDGFVQFVAGA